MSMSEMDGFIWFDGELVPREGIEVDAVGLLLHRPQAVGVGAGEDLLEHRLGLVQVVGGEQFAKQTLTMVAMHQVRGLILAQQTHIENGCGYARFGI